MLLRPGTGLFRPSTGRAGVSVNAGYGSATWTGYAPTVATASALTWNTTEKSANITLSNGNLDAVSVGGAAFNAVLASVGRSTGKYYVELYVAGYDGANNNFFIFGLATTNASYTTYPGNWASGFGMQGNNSKFQNGFTSVNPPSSDAAAGRVIRFAVDLDGGKVWVQFDTNGWNFPSTAGDPAAGTNPSWTFTSPKTLYPAVALFQNNPTNKVRLLTGGSLNYTPPSGFTAW